MLASNAGSSPQIVVGLIPWQAISAVVPEVTAKLTLELVGVTVIVGVIDGVTVVVGVTVGVTVDVTVGVGVTVEVTVGVGVAVGVTDGVGVICNGGKTPSSTKTIDCWNNWAEEYVPFTSQIFFVWPGNNSIWYCQRVSSHLW